MLEVAAEKETKKRNIRLIMSGEAKVLNKHGFSAWFEARIKPALIRSNSFDFGLVKAQRDNDGML